MYHYQIYTSHFPPTDTEATSQEEECCYVARETAVFVEGVGTLGAEVTAGHT